MATLALACGSASAQSDGQPASVHDANRSPLGWPAAPLEGPLVSDRPDFTESTETVPWGRVQIEMGYTFTYDREHDVRIRESDAPELLVRLGLFKDFELRIDWEGYLWTQTKFQERNDVGRTITFDDWAQGATDLSLGFKYRFSEQDGWRPNLAVIAETSVPSGSADTSSGDVDPTVIFCWAYDLNDRFSLAGNVGIASLTEDDNDRFVQATGSMSLSASLTDRLGGFLEYFGLYPNSENTDCAHSFDTGLTYLINDNLQLDWRVGFGLNEEAPDFFTGFGLAWRF